MNLWWKNWNRLMRPWEWHQTRKWLRSDDFKRQIQQVNQYTELPPCPDCGTVASIPGNPINVLERHVDDFMAQHRGSPQCAEFKAYNLSHPGTANERA